MSKGCSIIHYYGDTLHTFGASSSTGTAAPLSFFFTRFSYSALSRAPNPWVAGFSSAVAATPVLSPSILLLFKVNYFAQPILIKQVTLFSWKTNTIEIILHLYAIKVIYFRRHAGLKIYLSFSDAVPSSPESKVEKIK